MKALIKTKNKLSVVDLDKPSVEKDRVLVKIIYAGICGSDIHIWKNTNSWKTKDPLVLGHEFCGVVVSKPEHVKKFVVGDYVCIETSAYVCKKCKYCTNGSYNLCTFRRGYGALEDGAFCEYLNVRPEILHKIDIKKISLEEASIIEPLCVVLNAITARSKINKGDKVLILGPGTIGQLALQIAKLSGAGLTVMIGKKDDNRRLEIAKKLGVNYIFDNVSDKFETLSKTIGGFDCVVDCSGSTSSFDVGLKNLRSQGFMTKIGWSPERLVVNLDLIVAKEITIYGAFSHTPINWKTAIKLVENKKINLKIIIGGIYNIKNWRSGFNLMYKKKSIKSILSINEK